MENKQKVTNASLDEKDLIILRHYRNDPNVKKKDIAAALGISANALSMRLRKQMLKDAITDIVGDVQEVLAQAKGLAARRLKRLIMSENEMIALRASTEVLKGELDGPSRVVEPLRFITIVNDVGVLESMAAEPIIDVITTPVLDKD